MFVDRLKDLAYQLRGESEDIVCVLGWVAAEKPQIMIIASDNVVASKGINAVEAIRAIAKHIQGGGGGQPFFASAGGKNAAGMEAAMKEAKYYFQDKLK